MPRLTLHRSSLFAVALALLVSACADRGEPLEPQLSPQDAPVAYAAAEMSDIRDVVRRNTPGLMARAGIIGTGIRVAGERPGIVVYAVSRGHADQARVPARLEGHPVEVVVTGLITTRDANNPQTKERPAPNGFSVGHPDITAGTIGAKVKDAAGNSYILSNNHVIANSNSANIGDATLQPGPYDGGTSADQIGTLWDYEPISFSSDNVMDAAIARVNGNDLTGATPTSAYGAPSTTLYSGTLLNKGVQKFGRTTGHTTGTITEVNVTVSVCYETRGPFGCASAATFVDQIGISPGSFSSGGDSGSLIVTNDSNKQPVALLFAGSDTRTLANPIGPVMQRFGIQIDNAGGGTDPEPDPDPTDNPPSAAFAVSCNNSGCSFTDQSTDDNGVTSWAWNFGDGSSSTQRNPTHRYTSAGSYTVTLTVTDAAGQSDSASRTLNCTTRGPNVRCS